MIFQILDGSHYDRFSETILWTINIRFLKRKTICIESLLGLNDLSADSECDNPLVLNKTSLILPEDESFTSSLAIESSNESDKEDDVFDDQVYFLQLTIYTLFEWHRSALTTEYLSQVISKCWW